MTEKKPKRSATAPTAQRMLSLIGEFPGGIGRSDLSNLMGLGKASIDDLTECLRLAGMAKCVKAGCQSRWYVGDESAVIDAIARLPKSQKPYKPKKKQEEKDRWPMVKRVVSANSAQPVSIPKQAFSVFSWGQSK